MAEVVEANEYEWMDAARCRGADTRVWFPTTGETTDEAMAVCQGCPVSEDCLEYALERHIEHGTFGGRSERERRRILRERRRVAS